MDDPNPNRRNYAVGEIVLTPNPAESYKKDVNISQGKIIKKVHSREPGYFYQVLLPVKPVDPLGQNVVFPGEGEDRTMISVSGIMLSKTNKSP